MSIFYSISKEGVIPSNKYQLRNLGSQITSFITVSRKRGYMGEYKGNSSKEYFRAVTENDYDKLFASEIKRMTPPYDIPQFLEYHYDYYKLNSKEDRFFDHIECVILPILETQKDHSVSKKLVWKWLNSKGRTSSEISNSGININGNTDTEIQIQVKSDNSKQRNNSN